jgi:mRNA-degrading endonuclease RelE of RelBE toxin-antitoxin system/GNAT superfamily N-acetyltransferase
VVDKDALKELKEFPAHLKDQLSDALVKLKEPNVPGVKKLEGFSSVYRLGVGNRRILFIRLKDKVVVIGFAERNDLYDKKMRRRLQNADKRTAASGPHADWAKGVLKAWKKVSDAMMAHAKDVTTRSFEQGNLKAVNDLYIEFADEIENAKRFIARTAEDIKINRGLFIRVPKQVPRDRGGAADKQRVLRLLSDASEALDDAKAKTSYTADALNPQMGFRHDKHLVDRWEWAVRGMGHQVIEGVEAATKAFTKAMKYLSEVQMPPEAHVPDTVDHHGMKLVFLDQHGIAPREHGETADKLTRHPVLRKDLVRAFDSARNMLSHKGLGFLWYGQTFVYSDAHAYDFVTHDGVKRKAAANYNIQTDIVNTFCAPDTESVEGFARLVAHELGHRFWFKFLTEADRAEFSDLFGDVEAVTEYGGTSAEEDFAEVFSYYIDGKDLTRDQLERFRKFIDNHKRRKASIRKADRPKAMESEHPHKAWAQDLLEGWTYQYDQAADKVLEVPNIVTMKREAQGLLKYVVDWRKDAQTNRGLHKYTGTSPDRSSPEAHSIYCLRAAEKELQTCIQQFSLRMDEDADYDKLTRKFDEHTAFANKYIQEATKAFSEIELQFEEPGGEEQFDFHGVSVSTMDDAAWPADLRQKLVRRLDEAYNALRAKNLSSLWKGNIHLTRISAGIPKGAIAAYNMGTDAIEILRPSASARSIVHEVGHRFWFKNLTETDRNEFMDWVAQGNVDFVTGYARTNGEEAFAEVFAHYVMEQDLTRDQLEQFRRYLDKHKSRRASTLDQSGAYKTWAHGPAKIEYRFDPREDVFDIASLRVPPKAQGQGLAREAMTAFLAAADATGKGTKLLASPLTKATKLPVLVRFYESLGFKTVGRGNPAGDPLMLRPAMRTAATHTLRHYDHGDLGLARMTCQFCGREFDSVEDAQAYMKALADTYELEHEPDMQEMNGQAWVDVMLPRTAGVLEFPMAQRLRAQHEAWKAMVALDTRRMAMPEELKTWVSAWVRDIDKNPSTWELFKPCAKAVQSDFKRALAALEAGNTQSAAKIVDSAYEQTGIYDRFAAAHDNAEAIVAAILKRQPGFRKYMTGVTVKRADPRPGRHPEATTEGTTILLFPKFDALDMGTQEHVLAHELGHVWLSKYGFSRWVSDLNEYGIDPWDTDNLPYGQFNSEEAFAECFAVRLTDPQHLERVYPRWSAMLDDVM